MPSSIYLWQKTDGNCAKPIPFIALSNNIAILFVKIAGVRGTVYSTPRGSRNSNNGPVEDFVYITAGIPRKSSGFCGTPCCLRNAGLAHK